MPNCQPFFSFKEVSPSPPSSGSQPVITPSITKSPDSDSYLVKKKPRGRPRLKPRDNDDISAADKSEKSKHTSKSSTEAKQGKKQCHLPNWCSLELAPRPWNERTSVAFFARIKSLFDISYPHPGWFRYSATYPLNIFCTFSTRHKQSLFINSRDESDGSELL